MPEFWKAPPGWEWSTLGAEVELDAVGSAKGGSKEGPYYNLNGVPEQQPEEGPAPRGAIRCDDKSLLVGLAGGEVKVVAPTVPGLATARWQVIRPKPSMNRQFLAWYLRALTRLMPASTWAEYIPGALAGLPVPVPRVADAVVAQGMQRRIAAFMADNMADWQKAYRLAAELESAARQVVPAAVRDFFADAAMQKWTKYKLSNVAEMDEGPGQGKDDSSNPLDPLLVDIGDVSEAKRSAGPIRWANLRRWAPNRDVSGLELREGDILLDHKASATGRVFRLTGENPAAVCSRNFMRLRAGGEIEQGFFYWVLQTTAFQQSVAHRKRQATGLVSLNRTLLEDIAVPVPSRAEQQRAARYLDDVEQQAFQLIRHSHEAMRLLERVATALYRAAFMGTEG